jgi:hypothetical protein
MCAVYCVLDQVAKIDAIKKSVGLGVSDGESMLERLKRLSVRSAA